MKDSNELEAVMVVNGTSWVGLGWRPNNLTSSCRAFPDINDPPGEPLPKPEPKSEPEPEPEAEATAEPEPKAEFTAEPISTTEPEPSTEPEPNSEPEPSKSNAKRRSPKIYNENDDSDVTVHTSVTYQVSTKQGIDSKLSGTSFFIIIIIPNLFLLIS